MRSGIAGEKAGHRGASLKVRRPNWTLLGAAFGIFLAAASANAQNARIDWYRVANGGGVSTSNGCMIMGTSGQAEPGFVQAGNVTVAEGFWSADAVVPPLVTPAADFTYTTNLVYQVGIMITGFSSTGYADVVQAGGHLNFPDTINGYPVLWIEGFGNRTALVSVRIPDSVTKIYDYAFEYCTNLTNLTIGTNVTAINDVVFSFCDHLSNVTLPDSLVWIGSETFSYCHALTSINIPNNVRTIGDQTFFGCTSLTNLTIGNSVMSINTEAFAYCYALRSVTIPASMIAFGVGMFYGCSSLTSAYFLCNPPPCNGSPGSLNTDTFYGEVGMVYYAPNTTGWTNVYGGWPTAAWKPKIVGAGGGAAAGGSNFHFNISWMPNTSMVVEGSTDLLNWTPVSTNRLTSGAAYFSDPQWTNYPSRFYRLRSQ